MDEEDLDTKDSSMHDWIDGCEAHLEVILEHMLRGINKWVKLSFHSFIRKGLES